MTEPRPVAVHGNLVTTCLLYDDDKWQDLPDGVELLCDLLAAQSVPAGLGATGETRVFRVCQSGREHGGELANARPAPTAPQASPARGQCPPDPKLHAVIASDDGAVGLPVVAHSGWAGLVVAAPTSLRTLAPVDAFSSRRASGERSDPAVRRWVLLLDADDLRAEVGILLSRGRSWDRTGRELYFHLLRDDQLERTSAFGVIIVRVGVDAALVVRPNGATIDRRATLVFDHRRLEGEWHAAHGAKMSQNVHLAFAARVIAGLAIATEQQGDPDWGKLVRGALVASRVAAATSIGAAAAGDPRSGARGADAATEVDFADAAVPLCSDSPALDDLERPTRGWTTALGAQPGAVPWSIARQRLVLQEPAILDVARRIVTDGTAPQLDEVPKATFGVMTKYDRAELETYSTVRNLIEHHLADPSPARPLCLAVFGSPGSGKSFGVTQVARSLAKTVKLRELTFNLSQFQSYEQLVAALHSVRDVQIGGSVPLVLFDEFDADFEGRALGWLKYMLAPMHDASFLDHGEMRPLGKPIFVFAGGTCTRFSEFARPRSDDSWTAAKGPDFVSRLRGYIDVLGPDPMHSADDASLVRRAEVIRTQFLTRPRLRSAVEGPGPERVRIDPGVLRALLHVSRYRHGARSLAAIFEMCELGCRSTFDMSALPPFHELDMHLPADEFMFLLARERFVSRMTGECRAQLHARAASGNDLQQVERFIVEHVAKAIHAAYTPTGGSPAAASWDGLSPRLQLSNLDAAADVPAKLARAGLWVRAALGEDAARSTRTAATRFSEIGPELRESLARAEHERWCRERRLTGTRAPVGEHEWNEQARAAWDAAGYHQRIVPWDDLTPGDQRIDSALLDAIDGALASLGLELVQLSGGV